MTAHSPSNQVPPEDPFGSMEVDPTEPEDTHMVEASDPAVTQFTLGTLRPMQLKDYYNCAVRGDCVCPWPKRH